MDDDLLVALKANDHLKLKWDKLLSYVRAHLGLTRADLSTALYQEGQAEGESVATYVTRFDLIRRELKMSGEAARTLLLKGLNDGGARFFARRVENAMGLCADEPVEDAIEEVSYEEIYKLLKAPEWYSRPPKKDKHSISMAARVPTAGSVAATYAAAAPSSSTAPTPAGRMADVVMFNPAIGSVRPTVAGGSYLAPA